MTGAPFRILVIDDDDDIRTTLADLLEGEGYDVATARDGLSALAELHSDTPSPWGFIVLDLMMPGMNGWNFLRARKSDELIARIPVAVVTADAKAVNALDEFDVVERLLKPFDWNRLVQAIEKAASARATI